MIDKVGGKQEWAVRHRLTHVITPQYDQPDAENTARINPDFEVVTRVVFPWATVTTSTTLVEDEPPLGKWRIRLRDNTVVATTFNTEQEAKDHVDAVRAHTKPLALEERWVSVDIYQERGDSGGA